MADGARSRAGWTTNRSRSAVQLASRAGHEQNGDTGMTAVLVRSRFRNGVIEIGVSAVW